MAERYNIRLKSGGAGGKSHQAQVRAIIASLEGFTTEMVKKITLDIHANLLETNTAHGTPVDTGWARANWVPSIGVPHLETEGDRKSVSTATQDAGVQDVILNYDTKKGPAFVSNNVPYVIPLNEGSSKKAPAGFVQNAIVKAVTVDQKDVKDVK